MNANEFLHKKNVAYMNRLSTSLDFNAVVALMEEYAALRIHDFVGRSEQLQPDEEAYRCKRCNCYGCVCDVIDGI